jgi:U3 small nucleolar RNA-associated protein 6
MKWMVDVETKTISVPFFDVAAPGFRTERLDKAFQKYQLIHLRNAGKQVDKRDKVDWKGIGRLFGLLNADDQDSWCVETQNGPKLSAETFLAPKLTKARAYGSFLIQSDKNAYKTAVEQLPLQELGGTQWYYEPALWLFFGRNAFGNNDLEGRPEHTDSVSHDGTWHYQLSGTKHWYLRPSPKLMAHFHTSLPPSQCKALDESMSVRLDCAEGDVIVINTRLWFHRTVVPAQKRPSVSYARDFRRTKPLAAQNGSDMKNVDGLYATKDIQAGSVIFTENDMPDCELHRSSANPNCEVVDLEDGTNAVVSRRSIPEGEFFCIAESSDEEECSDDDSSTSDN